MRRTPQIAKIYLLLSAFLLALPGLSRHYEGLTGKLLVATYSIDRGIFQHSVLYVVHHDLFGARGFVVNKPLPEDFKTPDSRVLPRYAGGPVRPDEPSFVLARGEMALRPWFFPDEKSESEDAIAAARRKIADGRSEARLLFGYAGWTFLQLNFEILRGRWAVIDYDPALVFETPPEELWDRAVKRALKKAQNGIDRRREPI